MELEESESPAVGSPRPADLQQLEDRELAMQRPEVGPPSPESLALATPVITPPDDEDEDRLLKSWRRSAYESFDWFADPPGASDG
jgi:hypothetical protein